MNTSDFDFTLPGRLIAQQPAASRDASRLLALDRSSGTSSHHRFRDLVELLRPNDLLVINDTRVIPARLVGRKPSGGRVELLLVEAVDPARSGLWRCMVKASRLPAVDSPVDLGPGLTARLVAPDPVGWQVLLEAADGRLESVLDRLGRMPLPPYIRRDGTEDDAIDRERYQTVYARRPGAIAAPTAGLHFTPELLVRLNDAGIAHTCVTLHVGLGTFRPVTTEQVEDHRIHREPYEISQSAARAIAATRRRSGRIVAVGTTVVRTLEASASPDGEIRPGSGDCSLFIYPGYRFRAVDAMITNFHLPRSTLLMLVSAFAGRERILEAYREAIESEYRFYSYGDAMLIAGAA